MAEGELSFDPASTVLVLVDLQNFTLALETVPHPTSKVLANSIRLAEACRRAGILVVLVRVGHDDNKMPHPSPKTDASFGGFQQGPEAKEIPPELGPRPGDVIVDKYNWGAFHGTNLDTHLRRRGIDTLIVGGLTTNVGVDTTMRQAQERGYHQVLVEDAAAAMSPEEHDYVLRIIAPRLSRVRRTEEVLQAIERTRS
ncbi:MAG TPA: isochorismatase family protein [Allosphingosinicella sp.]|jgi:nicotinamidase-related amidase|nr:isochorismatase family protein [Allosphingosinicella sp.]